MEVKRDLNFEVKNAKQLNEMLTGVLMDVRRGALDHDTVKSITLVADKINKNNVNILKYKKITKNQGEIDFFKDNVV